MIATRAAGSSRSLPGRLPPLRLVLRAAHPRPSVAVALLVTAYAASVGLSPARIGLVAGAVLAGQLTIGWCNDLVDAPRDREVGRSDKPLATGELSAVQVRRALGVSVAATLVLSLACGPVAGAVHLVCVAAGWAYDLRVKATAWSWLPYAVAFGGLPAFVTLAGPEAALPPAAVMVAGALLGVGAHFVNVVPDLVDDAATGVRGLPHRLGARGSGLAAVVALAAATAVLAPTATGLPPVVLLGGLVLVATLAVVALLGRGRAPFRAAVGIAAVDVALLVLA